MQTTSGAASTEQNSFKLCRVVTEVNEVMVGNSSVSWR